MATLGRLPGVSRALGLPRALLAGRIVMTCLRGSMDEVGILGESGICTCGAPGIVCYDPFLREIYDEWELNAYCDDCFDLRADEI